MEVANSVKDLMPTFRSQLPASVSLHVLYDRSVSIRDSVKDVQFTLLFTLVLVVLVIFLFLRNLVATVIPSMAMPMSVVGTFAVMYLLDYSLNNLSLMALILSIGFVVDDAIVMLENIVRHREMGEGMLEASLNGSREIGFTIVSMTLSLAAVFIPVLFMGGILGRLFREFAVSIGVAVLISGFISLTLTPMLCSRFLRHQENHHQGWLYTWSERIFDGMLRIYQVGLRWVLGHQRSAMIFSAVILVATIILFGKIPKGFIPSEDTGRIFGLTEAAEGISFDAMVQHQRAVAAVVREDPNVTSFMSAAGARGGTAATINSGTIMLRLKPRSERKHSADEIIQQLRTKLAQVTGIRVYLQNPPPIRIGGQLTKSQYQYTLQSPDPTELYRLAPMLADKIRAIPGVHRRNHRSSDHQPTGQRGHRP